MLVARQEFRILFTRMQSKRLRKLQNFSTPEIVYGQLANTFIVMGDAEMAQGKNPEKNHNEAIANYEQGDQDRSEQIDSSNYSTYLNLGETEIIASGWLIKNRKDPEASLNAARENLQKARQLNSMEPELYALWSDYSLKLAQWQEMQKKDFQKTVEEGIAMADQALALNPKLPKAFAVRAMLNAFQARGTNDDKYVAAARSDWQKALSINKSLSLKYDLKLD